MNRDGESLRVGMLVHRHDDRAVSRLVTALCGAMSEQGARPVLLRVDATPQALPVPPGTEVVDVGAGRSRTALAILALARRLRQARLDVLFAHLNGPGRAALVASALAGVDLPVVPVEHVHYSTFYRDRHGLQDVLTRWCYPHAARVAGVSPGVVDELATRFPAVASRTVVLRSIGPDAARVAAAQAPLSHPWFTGADRPLVMVSVANVVARKGQDVAVRALPAVRAALGDVRLALIGRLDEPAYAARLSDLAARLHLAEHVWQAGYIADPLPYIAQADAFLLTSETEGAPTVLLEAMACGTPAISTDCPVGPRFVLDGGRCGQLVPVGDVDAVARAAVNALTAPEWKTVVPAAARVYADRFTPASVAGDYLELARTVIAERRHASAPRDVPHAMYRT